MKRLLAAAAVLALSACGGGTGLAVDLPGVRSGLEVTPAEDRRPAPKDEVALVSDEDTTVSVPDYAGKVLVVNFWATWCGPCLAEQPDLSEAYERLAGPEVEFLGVNIQDSRPNAIAWAKEHDVAYESVFDPSNAYAAKWGGVGPRAIPTTILVDQEGRVVTRLFGRTTADELVGLVGYLVAPSDPDAA